MRKLILTAACILGISGCTMNSNYYTKEEIDSGLTGLLTPMINDINNLKVKVFPEAAKVSEANNNCPVDIKTMKCIAERK